MASHGKKSGPGNGLTPIHSRIHCAATTEGGDFNDEYDELERFQVEHFLHTLAKIAMAVAARQAGIDRAELG